MAPWRVPLQVNPETLPTLDSVSLPQVGAQHKLNSGGNGKTDGIVRKTPSL